MQKEINNNTLIKTISDYVDLESIPGNILYAQKLRYKYDCYDLYRIGRFDGIIFDKYGKGIYPHDIAEINGKYIFFYPHIQENKSNKIMEKKIIEIIDKVGFSEQYCRHVWYIAQSKLTGECTVVRATNQDMEPYEIPEIRTVLSNQPNIGAIDIVACENDFILSDNKDRKNDTQPFPPERYRSIFTIYNRTDSCLYWETPADSLGYFAWVNGKDTLRLHMQTTYLEDMKIDDPDYNYDFQKVYRFDISCEDARSFFSKIPKKNYYNDLYNLMRDSIFYFPYIEKYKMKTPDSCYYPKQKIKVMFPVECGYTLITPQKNYHFEDGHFIDK